jgi:hypothetical protein
MKTTRRMAILATGVLFAYVIACLAYFPINLIDVSIAEALFYLKDKVAIIGLSIALLKTLSVIGSINSTFKGAIIGCIAITFIVATIEFISGMDLLAVSTVTASGVCLIGCPVILILIVIYYAKR